MRRSQPHLPVRPKGLAAPKEADKVPRIFGYRLNPRRGPDGLKAGKALTPGALKGSLRSGHLTLNRTLGAPVPWNSSDRSQHLPDDWEDRRSLVLRRANWLCQIQTDGCLRKATDVDHKHPGDDHSYENLQASCNSCHLRKSSREGHAAKRKLRAQRRRPLDRHPGMR